MRKRHLIAAGYVVSLPLGTAAVLAATAAVEAMALRVRRRLTR
ncbi:hypothetical protein Ade02nite_17090 [Paractinoplanes deccanensis]|uniref:Uncharacterized protein n=1 Tax=Paractinoplanes deccanensis TaxID=113561 RepID=A0ABQ3XZB0_9ACTN|nr:hypothetical protein [Actinoplanes deccanensis]GID73068.1 hypothetical protein Ade02nite_17090 [Actinoplanes deccanensis]